jgi:predicted phosphoribosyltransferase
MPGQQERKKNVRYASTRFNQRRKLNPMMMEFKNRNVLIVDDSIVRGTTSREIVQMARDCGARRVYFASCAPPIRFPNVRGCTVILIYRCMESICLRVKSWLRSIETRMRSQRLSTLTVSFSRFVLSTLICVRI